MFSLIFINVSYLKSDISLNGYQEFFAGSADQTTQTGLAKSTGASTNTNFNGFSNGIYTRLIAVAETSLENGLEVIGTLVLAKDSDLGGDGDIISNSVDQNDLSVFGNFGSLTIGQTGSAGTLMHFRPTAIIPTGEPDGGVLQHFYTVGNGTYGNFDEPGYSADALKMRYLSNKYNGFSFGISYSTFEPSGTANPSGTDQNACSEAQITGHVCYDGLIDYVVKYEGNYNNLNYGVSYGWQTGNTSNRGSTTNEYNELKNETYSFNLDYSNFTIQYKFNDLGDSGVISSSSDAGNNESNSLCANYLLEKFSIGVCDSQAQYDEVNQEVTNTDKRRYLAIGYIIGSGVSLEAVYASIKQEDNGIIDTEADILMSKLSYSF